MNPTLGVAQFPIVREKQTNIQSAVQAIKQAYQQGVQYFLLPEMFTCPYEGDQFAAYAEDPAHSETLDTLHETLQHYPLYLIAGSIPEKDADSGSIYNTSFVFEPSGEIVGTYRKIHLFDVDLPDVKVTESTYLQAGDIPLVIKTPALHFGVAICFDIRFPELIRTLVVNGAECLFLPGAFSTTTGKAHWHIAMRSRAIDNQIYVACSGPAPSPDVQYAYYGHSLIVEPFGNLVAEAEQDRCICTAVFSKEHLNQVRAQLPLLKLRRPDLYSTV